MRGFSEKLLQSQKELESLLGDVERIKKGLSEGLSGLGAALEAVLEEQRDVEVAVSSGSPEAAKRLLEASVAWEEAARAREGLGELGGQLIQTLPSVMKNAGITQRELKVSFLADGEAK